MCEASGVTYILLFQLYKNNPLCCLIFQTGIYHIVLIYYLITNTLVCSKNSLLFTALRYSSSIFLVANESSLAHSQKISIFRIEKIRWIIIVLVWAGLKVFAFHLKRQIIVLVQSNLECACKGSWCVSCGECGYPALISLGWASG